MTACSLNVRWAALATEFGTGSSEAGTVQSGYPVPKKSGTTVPVPILEPRFHLEPGEPPKLSTYAMISRLPPALTVVF